MAAKDTTAKKAAAKDTASKATGTVKAEKNEKAVKSDKQTTPKSKPSKLGKGLNSMFGSFDEDITEETETKNNKETKTDEASSGDGVTIVKITKVEPNRNQPRKNFDEDSLQELADSIKAHGIIQPIVVQDRGTYYQIIAGERRWRASKIAGLKEIPVVIKHYESEQEIVEVSLIENIQREELDPIEEAYAYKELVEKFKMTQDKISESVGKSRSEITNSMRLLKLCPEVQQMIIDKMISKGHARTLVSVEDSKKQYEIAQLAFDKKLSVREVEKLVKNLDKAPKLKPATDEQLLLIYNQIQEQLKETLGTKVTISAKGKGSGSISIEFYNHDDFDKIVYILKNKTNE